MDRKDWGQGRGQSRSCIVPCHGWDPHRAEKERCPGQLQHRDSGMFCVPEVTVTCHQHHLRVFSTSAPLEAWLPCGTSQGLVCSWDLRGRLSCSSANPQLAPETLPSLLQTQWQPRKCSHCPLDMTCRATGCFGSPPSQPLHTGL